MADIVSLVGQKLPSGRLKIISIIVLLLLAIIVVALYTNNLSPRSADESITKNVYSTVKSFATAYTTTRTNTAKSTVIINNLWRPTDQITAGAYHTCAIANGQAYCWGYNAYGQLGNNSLSNSSFPVAVHASGVLAGKTVTQISAGGNHTCAIANGIAYCWGYNLYGQLGNNSNTDSSVPVAVYANTLLEGKTVTQISAGGEYTCATANGIAYCWGYNVNSQLGNLSTTNSNKPVAVSTNGVLNNKGVSQVTSGIYHTCATADSKAYCWGNNASGQLGNNSTTNSDAPVAVNTGPNGTIAVIVGEHHTCAIANSRAYCWGYNLYGQLGNNSTTNSSIPVAVDTSGVLNNKAITQIIGRAYHTCAIANSRAYCWGSNASGQFGNNSTTNSSIPVAVDTSGVLVGKTITQIVTGRDHSCTIANGQAYCWGYNVYGQLGNDTATNTTAPGLRVNTY